MRTPWCRVPPQRRADLRREGSRPGLLRRRCRTTGV